MKGRPVVDTIEEAVIVDEEPWQVWVREHWEDYATRKELHRMVLEQFSIAPHRVEYYLRERLHVPPKFRKRTSATPGTRATLAAYREDPDIQALIRVLDENKVLHERIEQLERDLAHEKELNRRMQEDVGDAQEALRLWQKTQEETAEVFQKIARIDSQSFVLDVTRKK